MYSPSHITSVPFDIFQFKVVPALELSFLKMPFISFFEHSDLQHLLSKKIGQRALGPLFNEDSCG